MSHSRYLQTRISLATPLRVDESQAQTPYPTITATLLDRKITFMTIPTIIDEVRKTCQDGRKIVIASWNVHSFNLSFQLPWFYDFMQTAEIAMCDGSGILKTVNGLGLNLPLDYRATGTELIPNLLESAKHAGFSFFL
ncbi:MAG: glycosyltransferase, partial [Cyanobacteria bacterium P01_D01_bin.115]